MWYRVKGEGLNIARIPRSYVYILWDRDSQEYMYTSLLLIYMSYYPARLVTCRLYATVATDPVILVLW